jgi:GTPase SAR1 family protein
MNDPYDYLFKFLVIGSAGTGKSCLLHQFIENRFKEESSHTIGNTSTPPFQAILRNYLVPRLLESFPIQRSE